MQTQNQRASEVVEEVKSVPDEAVPQTKSKARYIFLHMIVLKNILKTRSTSNQRLGR